MNVYWFIHMERERERDVLMCARIRFNMDDVMRYGQNCEPEPPVHVLASAILACHRAAQNQGRCCSMVARASRQVWQSGTQSDTEETLTFSRESNVSNRCTCAAVMIRVFGWHYLSNATCLIRYHVFYASLVVSPNIIPCYIIQHV